MPPPKIALFANKDSPQLLALRDVLKEEGASSLIFDIQLGGPSAPKIVICRERLEWEGIDFSEIEVAHIRCMAVNTPSTMPAVLNAASYSESRSQYLREQEYQSVTYSFFEQLQAGGKLVINPLTSAYLDHELKPSFMKSYARRGLLFQGV